MTAVKTWDVETTIHTSLKRKGNPFDGRNWVVTHAFANKGEAPVEYRFGSNRPPAGWLKPVLEGTKLLCGFNIKFDLLHALQDNDNLDAWMDYVAGGGNVWDCQLAEYLLNGMGQKEQMLSLDEVAPRYGGEVKIDEVKTLWAAGVQTNEIEPALLSRYLVGGADETGEWRPGDIQNTERVALAQIARARDVGQINSIMMNMGSLLCTIEMERNGMFVDKPLGLILAEELRVRIEELRIALTAYLPPDLPFDYKWTSTKQKSAFIFGGKVPYDAYEYDTKEGGTILKTVYDDLMPEERPVLVYAQKDETHYMITNGTTMECALWEHLTWHPDGTSTDAVTYTSGKNAGEKKTKKVKVNDLTKPKGRKTKTDYIFPRMTQPRKAWAASEEGYWSTSAEVIEELATRNIPFLKGLQEFSSATKDLGTYFIVIDDEGNEKGMLALVDPHGVIHHKINHTSTVTGRFSSSDPNLQNIPKGNKSQVKRVFVSRFGDKGEIIQSDFSSLEIYVQAILTQCKQLIIDLRAGLDMHVLRLSNSEGLPYDDLLILCKGDKKTGAPPVKEWEYKRTDSKVYSFQAAYGAGDNKIADTTGMPIDRVAALRAADDARYPEIVSYFKERAKEIGANRRPTGVAVPHPDVKGVFCHLGRSTVRTPDGKLYSYLESPSPEYLVSKGIYASFSPTEIKNYEVQGEGGEWAKAAMWLAIRAFYKRKNFGGQAVLVNQVHDALYLDSHVDVRTEAASLLHACMEGASAFMEYFFKWDIPLPVPSETKSGPSMMEEKSVEGMDEFVAQFRDELRTEYMNDYIPTFQRNA